MYARKTEAVYLTAVLLLGLAGIVGGCNFDPWPEPDPAEEETADNGAGGDPGDTSFDGEADEDAGQETADDSDFDGAEPDQAYVYCSAPNAEGWATVVGLPGAAVRNTEIYVSTESGEKEIFPVDQDGSFAGRIAAEPEEELVIAADEEAAGENLFFELQVGVAVAEPADATILGNGAAAAPDGEGQVAISGDGEMLKNGLLVLGGNVTRSTGRDTLVSCSAGCRFDLFLPGESGDEIDIFLVRTGEHSGVTAAETVVAPEP